MIFFKTLVAFLLKPFVLLFALMVPKPTFARWLCLVINAIGLSMNLANFEAIPGNPFLIGAISWQIPSVILISVVLARDSWKKTKEEVITREAQKSDPKSGGITEC